MEIINQFLREENAKAKFTITCKESKYPETDCIIKFLFIQFGIKSLRGYLFMPDFVATTDGQREIAFTSMLDKENKITLSSSNSQDIKSWYQFAQNSKPTFDNFLDIISEYDLSYEQNIGIQGHEFILKVSSDYIFTILDSGKYKINYTLTSKTKVVLSNFNEAPQIGLFEEDFKEVSFFTIPDLDEIFKWTLLLKSCTLILLKKEEEQFNNLELMDSPDSANLPTLSKEDKNNESNKSNNKDSPKKITFEETRRPSLKNSSKLLGNNKNRRLSVDADSLNNLKKTTNNQIEGLKAKRSKYRKTINIPEPISEPSIEPPTILNYGQIYHQDQYKIVPKKQSHKMSKEELLEIINPRVMNPLFNFHKYDPNYIFFGFQMPPVEYVPESEYIDSFKSLFYRSIGVQPPNQNSSQERIEKDPKLAFLLLSTIIANGFRGRSISELYQTPKQSSIMHDILFILRKYKENIFDFMLSIDDNKLASLYAPWSIIRNDRSFIEEINEEYVKKFREKNEFLDGDYIGSIHFEPTFPMPETVPFQFAFKPIEFIQKFIYDVLYFQRITNTNSQAFIISLSKMIYSLFSHYLVFEIDEKKNSSFGDEDLVLFPNISNESAPNPNRITVSSILSSSVSLPSFISDILSEVNPLKKAVPPWSHLMFQQDFSQSWILFWYSSFVENQLAENFSFFFKYPELLKKFYYPCSIMRNNQYIPQVAEILNLIENIGLSKDFELSNESLYTQITPSTSQQKANENKILKNIAGLIRFK